jgi:hypothetical protein
MKKYLLILFCFLSFFLWGQNTVSLENAQKAALATARGFKTSEKVTAAGEPALNLVYTAKGSSGTMKSADVDDKIYYYIFNVNQDQGFVIIAGNDIAVPVLGYSDESGWNTGDLPPALEWWMSQYREQIEQALDQNLKPGTDVQKQWADYINGIVPIEETDGSQTMKSAAYTPGTYLVQAQWAQGAPYNNMTPVLEEKHAVTGCVATAMAQIFHYWAAREGSLQYKASVVKNIPGYKVNHEGRNFSVDGIPQGTDFEWDSMSDTNPSSSDTSIAKLMLAAGTSVKMQYGLNVSVATPDGGFEYFGFKSTYKYRSAYYTEDYWDNLLKSELDKSQPIVYAGYDDNISAGHAFVCDGYKNDGTFHFNWGWGSYYQNLNCWMVTTAIEVDGTGYTFNNIQRIYYNIVPDSTNLSVSSITSSIEEAVLYPNPAHDVLHIKDLSGNGKNVPAVIYNIEGKAVKTISVKLENNIQIDISNLPKNTYILTIAGKNFRFIKE